MTRAETDELERRADLPLLWIVLVGVIVGAAGGLGAWIFRLMIGFVHNLLFLGRLDLDYDANVHTPASPWGAAVILVPVIGAIGVVYLVKNFAPEAKGHGVPEVMDAIYYKEGEIRPTVAAIKSAASALSIGSGGSVGREGPIIQIGAAFGSTVGKLVRLSALDTRLLVAAGAGSGIAATFNAPFGAILFSIELLLVTVSTRAILVVSAAVITGVEIARQLIGSGRAFTVLDLQTSTVFDLDWIGALALVVLGLMIGVVSAVLIKGLYWTEDQFEGRFKNPYLAHMTGMLVVGLGMYAFFLWLGTYSIQGVGYATITDVLQGALTNPWTLLALAVAKLIVTSLTLGSGASGGIFSPALFVGATIGAGLGQILIAAGVDVDPVVLALGGMAGAVAGTTGAALTAIAMITEMTGDLGALIPLVIVVIVAGSVRELISPSTMYTEKLVRRGRPVPQGLEAEGVGRFKLGGRSDSAT
ncbi:MAG: chloride channel protein [Actinobacteria bacterium]|nr:MAG: chloride channel protein [Actinomycetota bacterium]